MAESEQGTAREMETAAAVDLHTPTVRARAHGCEALAMLVRRGFHVSLARMDLPFDPSSLAPEAVDRVADALHHYAVRLFLRGAMKHPDGFVPEETTRFLSPSHARQIAQTLESIGLIVFDSHEPAARARMVRPVTSFGPTLEWYVAHELSRQLGFSVACGVKFHAPGVGGDLDVVAAAEGKLVYFELKSSPPKHLAEPEVGAFFDRVQALRPHMTLFVVDTALRLGDRVIPMLTAELARRMNAPPAPRRVERELWALTPHMFVVNARPDLVANLSRAIAEGLMALSPSPW